MIASSQPASISIAEPPITPPKPAGDDPANHPLVKGVMDKFAAKIVEVRPKSQ